MKKFKFFAVLLMLNGCGDFSSKQTSDCRVTEKIDSMGALFFLDKTLYFNNWRGRTIRIFHSEKFIELNFPQYISKIENSEFFFAKIKLHLKGRVIFCPADQIQQNYLIIDRLIFFRGEGVIEISPDNFDIKEGIGSIKNLTP